MNYVQTLVPESFVVGCGANLRRHYLVHSLELAQPLGNCRLSWMNYPLKKTPGDSGPNCGANYYHRHLDHLLKAVCRPLLRLPAHPAPGVHSDHWRAHHPPECRYLSGLAARHLRHWQSHRRQRDS
jgi:hypothetical protein